MNWVIKESGPKGADANMAFESEALALLSADSAPLLRFYEWEGFCATFGYFVDPAQYFDLEGVKRHNLTLARRPTGGGVIFHKGDLAFSIVVPKTHPFYALNPLESYHEINRRVLSAISSLDAGHFSLEGGKSLSRGGFCMAKPTQYDILLEGRKVGGAAQRKTNLGLLHQGSICLDLMDPSILKEVLKEGAISSSAIIETSYPLARGRDVEHFRGALKAALINSLTLS